MSEDKFNTSHDSGSTDDTAPAHMWVLVTDEDKAREDALYRARRATVEAAHHAEIARIQAEATLKRATCLIETIHALIMASDLRVVGEVRNG
jgi:hypothetical protein